MCKIGSTAVPIIRQQYLRSLAAREYDVAPVAAKSGAMVHMEPVESRAMAFEAEKLAHRLVRSLRVKKIGSKDVDEWYRSDGIITAKAVTIAVMATDGRIKETDEQELSVLIHRFDWSSRHRDQHFA